MIDENRELSPPSIIYEESITHLTINYISKHRRPAKADTAKRAGAAWPPPPTIDIGPSGHGTSLAVEMLASLANVIDCQSPKADNQLFSTSSRPLPAAPSRLGNFGA